MTPFASLWAQVTRSEPRVSSPFSGNTGPLLFTLPDLERVGVGDSDVQEGEFSRALGVLRLHRPASGSATTTKSAPPAIVTAPDPPADAMSVGKTIEARPKTTAAAPALRAGINQPRGRVAARRPTRKMAIAKAAIHDSRWT